MSDIQDISAERFARLLHYYRQILAHKLQDASKTGVAGSWERAPEEERRLQVAATRLALLDLSCNASSGPAIGSYTNRG
ncbi:MAG: hypothetical protein JWO91_574 [Acidobacteriaceae bacterium]|nr:hypothetical protein [Acidobacteriaceae bacterium]